MRTCVNNVYRYWSVCTLSVPCLTGIHPSCQTTDSPVKAVNVQLFLPFSQFKLFIKCGQRQTLVSVNSTTFHFRLNFDAVSNTLRINGFSSSQNSSIDVRVSLVTSIQPPARQSIISFAPNEFLMPPPPPSRRIV